MIRCVRSKTDCRAARTTRRARCGTPALWFPATRRIAAPRWVAVNIKRVLRVYREANLQVRKRVNRRVALGRGDPHRLSCGDERALVAGLRSRQPRIGPANPDAEYRRRFHRECLAIEVDTSLSRSSRCAGARCDRRVRGFPQTIVMDNGTELTGIAMACWARDRRVRLHFIRRANRPKTPTSNRSTAGSETNASTRTSSHLWLMRD